MTKLNLTYQKIIIAPLLIGSIIVFLPLALISIFNPKLWAQEKTITITVPIKCFEDKTCCTIYEDASVRIEECNFDSSKLDN